MTKRRCPELPVYTPSGRVGIRAVVIALCVGAPTALMAGWFYVWARASTGSFVTVALCDLLFMALATVAVGVLVAAMHSRSPAFNTVFAVTWVGTLLLPWWLYSISEAGRAGDAIADLPAQAQALGWIVEVAGKALEALLLGVAPVLVARGMADAPYSEAARTPGEKDFTGELYWHDDDRSALLSRLQEDGVAPLLGAPLASQVDTGNAASAWVTLKLAGRRVESDPAARWLDVTLVINERTAEGRVASRSDELASAWKLPEEAYAQLRGLFRSTSDRPAAERATLVASSDQADASRPLPAELEAAYVAMESDNYSASLAMARAQCMHPAEHVRADAYRLCALSLARLERWAEAFSDYHELFELEPSALNALQLACTSAMAGQLLRAEAWFQQAHQINSQTGELPPPRLRTNYLSALEQAGELSACRPHLDWLANGYRAMQPLDSHRLWMAEMPQLGEFLQRSQHLLGESMPPRDLRAWYWALREDLDGDAQAAIDRHLAQLA